MSKYTHAMVKLAEYAAKPELADLLLYIAQLPQARTASAALQNAAHRVRFDAYDAPLQSMKIDGREG